MLTNESIIVVSDNLTSADLGGEAVVLDLNKGVYYGLNEVGARVLELVKQPTSIYSILETLQREYEVDLEDLEKDIMEFLTSMSELKLIRVLDDTVA